MLNEKEQSIVQAVVRLAKVLMEEIGEEEAFHLLRRWIRESGIEYFQNLSQHLELPSEDALAGFMLAKTFGEAFGMRLEIIENTSKKVRYRIKECPIALSCDCLNISGQSLCNRVIAPALNNIMGTVIPGLKWSAEWGPIGGCRYQIWR